MRRFGVVAVAAALLLVACGNESGAEGQPTVSSTPSPETPSPETPSPEAPSPGSPYTPETPAPPGTPLTPEPPDGPVAQAKADLVKRLGVEAAQVTVVSSGEVTWPDGSLGCPEPGMNYTQALIQGSRIVLEAAGKQYHYHSGGTRPPFLCENPQR